MLFNVDYIANNLLKLIASLKEDKMKAVLIGNKLLELSTETSVELIHYICNKAIYSQEENFKDFFLSCWIEIYYLKLFLL